MNTSRKLLKSSGEQLDADNIPTEAPYTSGSFQFFSETQAVNATVVASNNNMILYPVNIKQAVTVDRIMAVVTANATPTAGAKFHAVAYTFVDNDTLAFYANLGEFDATIVGTATTNVQALTINQYFPAGQYFIGFQHNNVANITVFGHSLASYTNVGCTPLLTNMAGFLVKTWSGTYSYPKSAGNITISNTGLITTVPTFKFRVA